MNSLAGFLAVFRNIMHAAEVAAQIIAPIVATQDPVIGALMLQASNAAVMAEAAITDPGAGAQKASVVAASTKATVDAINSILLSQNKQPLPATINDKVQQGVSVLISGLNAVQKVVESAK